MNRKGWALVRRRDHGGRHGTPLWRHVRFALLTMCASWAASSTPSAWAACKIQHVEMPVSIVDQRPIAKLRLNGTEVSMLVDSGAFFSLLSESTATQLALPLRGLPFGMRIEGHTGRIDAKMTRVAKVGLLGVELSDIEFIVGGNELGAGIMGVLGRNFLSIADTEYDLAHGVVRLSFPKGECDKVSLAYWAGEAPVIEAPLSRQRSRDDTAIQLPVSINGQRLLALLDTGAAESLITLRAARRAGIEESALKPEGRAGGAGEGWVKSWSGPIASFELGGEKITHSRLRIEDVDSANQDMLLGLDYFLAHRIYVSRLQDKVYATWNGSATFARDADVSVKLDQRYAALPADIASDNADALARRGAAAIAAGNHARALEDLNRACELAPAVAEYAFARARLHLAMGQRPAALTDLDKALQLDPALSEARIRRARLHADLGDHPRAQADLAELDSSLPPSSALRAGMADLHARVDQPTQALRQFDLWISTHAKDARLASVLNRRCWLRTRLNIDLPLALQDCQQAVDLDEGDAHLRDSLGWVYLRLGDAVKAKKAFDGAIKLKPLAFSLYGRALAQVRLNQPGSAEQDLAEARKLTPTIDADVRRAGFEFADALPRPAAASP